jgi:hypothetical protein
MSNERPPWLRAMENGTIGEARTRSLLLERFWVLERSVDVEGADFIIMRRLTLKSLLDPAPPRLGFVQVKFFESAATTAHVHADYVLDRGGKPRTEFFVLAHTGREGDARTYFLEAEKLAAAMPLKEDEKGRRFVLQGAQVLADAYRANSPNVVLDVIERALERADLSHNRDFLRWVLPSAREEGPLPERFSAPFPIEGADRARGFRELRKKAQRSLYRIDEVREPLAKIATSTDPLEAFDLADTLEGQHTGSAGTYVMFDAGYDEESHRAWLAYSELHDLLEDQGLLLAVAEMGRRFENAAERGLFGVVNDNDMRISMLYAADTLDVRDITVEFTQAPMTEPNERRGDFVVHRVAPDQVELFWHRPAGGRCWHPAEGNTDEYREFVHCREHIASRAQDGFAKLLQDVIGTRFPNEEFRFYR